MKLLIIQQKMIGDVLTSSILFEALRQKYPEAQLNYLINKHTYPVVKNNPFIDKFHFVTPEIEKNKLQFYKFLISIKKEKYDAVIDVYGKLSSLLITLFSKAKVKSTYHKKHTAFLYSHTVMRLKTPQNNASLAIENRMRLIEPLGVSFKNFNPKIYLKDQEILNAKLYLEDASIYLDKPLFMISALGSSDIKTYPAKYMSKLLDTIVETNANAQLLFNYIPKQKEEAKTIFDTCLPKTKERIFFNVFGKNLREFLTITSHCNALIGNEGGANNMAKALNIATFTIFSPYLNKQNWFGESENNKHVAVHLSDFVNYNNTDLKEAKKQPKPYYLKFKPDFIIPKLKAFINQLN